MRRGRLCWPCAVTALSLWLSACGGPSTPAAKPVAQATLPPAAPDRWPEFAARFIESYFRANPFFAVQAGRHEFDGQMSDWSAAGIAAEVARLHAVRTEAQAFAPASLTDAERLEREIVLTAIDGDLFWLERAQSPFTNPAWYLEQLDPDVYLNRDYAPLATRLRGYTGYLRAIPKLAADIRANLRTPLPPSFVQRGIDDFGGYAEFFRKDGPRVFAGVQDATAQKELGEASAAAATAMQGLKAWLQGERRHATGRFALGEPLFLEMLRTTERVEVPLAQLLEVGRADLERNTEALTAACARYLPGGTPRACVERMRADKPTGGTVEGARAQLGQLRDFVVARKVVTIPSDERPGVGEAPPYNRSNAAYINIPGPYEKGVAYTYEIAPPDPSWNARERAEYIPGKASLLYTSVHEVWPGHFLQFLYSNRNPSKIAALWVGYAYAEGWAHYCEEMMWEEGLGSGDAEHNGICIPKVLDDRRTDDARRQLSAQIVEVVANLAQRNIRGALVRLVVELNGDRRDSDFGSACDVVHVLDAAQVIGDLLGDEFLDSMRRGAWPNGDDLRDALNGAGIFAPLHRECRGDRPDDGQRQGYQHEALVRDGELWQVHGVLLRRAQERAATSVRCDDVHTVAGLGFVLPLRHDEIRERQA